MRHRRAAARAVRPTAPQRAVAEIAGVSGLPCSPGRNGGYHQVCGAGSHVLDGAAYPARSHHRVTRGWRPVTC